MDAPRRSAKKVKPEAAETGQVPTGRGRKRKLESIKPQATSTPTPKGKAESVSAKRQKGEVHVQRKSSYFILQCFLLNRNLAITKPCSQKINSRKTPFPLIILQLCVYVTNTPTEFVSSKQYSSQSKLMYEERQLNKGEFIF